VKLAKMQYQRPSASELSFLTCECYETFTTIWSLGRVKRNLFDVSFLKIGFEKIF
jgi:hypothetical protein